MAGGLNKLSAAKVDKVKVPGYHGDGGGLWLQLSTLGGKSWVFRFTLHDRSREMGLGAFHTFSLADARLKAADCRKLVADGKDPIEERRKEKANAAAKVAKRETFAEAAKMHIKTHSPAFRSAKHTAQWTSTLETYVYPVMGEVDVADVDTDRVMQVLQPIWLTKTETATRVRGRIEAILDSAKVRGKRAGENPARWRGHLDKLLAKPRKLKRVKHHPALPYERIGTFFSDLIKHQGISARGLEFKILTNKRTAEVRGATWSEINLKKRVWTIPAERMKVGGLLHRVPLSSRALALIKKLPRFEKCDLLFPSPRGGQLSSAAFEALIDDMHAADVKRGGIGYMDPEQNKIATPHGTARSSFKDWVRNCRGTRYADEVSELALAHVNSDETRAAYARGELLSLRAKLAEDWARYCYTVKRSTKGKAQHTRTRKLA